MRKGTEILVSRILESAHFGATKCRLDGGPEMADENELSMKLDESSTAIALAL
jgi:hypothetical protein